MTPEHQPKTPPSDPWQVYIATLRRTGDILEALDAANDAQALANQARDRDAVRAAS